MNTNQSTQPNPISRRAFLKASVTAAAGAATIGVLPLERAAYAAGSDTIKVGLIGCGGRGTEAAGNAINAGKDVQITALADLFDERLKACRDQLVKSHKEQVNVPADRCFLGFDAYQKVIGAGVDVVLIAPASHFTPVILKAAIEAGKHVFCEKPHGIDMPGVRMCIAAADAAKAKGLTLVSGLCWRYDPGVRETMRRVHEGAIGDIVAIQETYVGNPYILRERKSGQSEMEWQLWNWYHFNWLSGDQTAQQLIHSLDKSSWALGDKPPVRAWGMGGRQTALGSKYGDQFDHQSVVFEYPEGVRVFGFCRDQQECWNNTSDYIIGTKGRCNLLSYRIEGEKPWRYEGPRANMYDVEHAELFAAIRKGQPINNGNYMCLSSAIAVMAQIACYTGQLLTWPQAIGSKRSFNLPRYASDVEPPVKPGPDGEYPSAHQGNAEDDKWLM